MRLIVQDNEAKKNDKALHSDQAIVDDHDRHGATVQAVGGQRCGCGPLIQERRGRPHAGGAGHTKQTRLHGERKGDDQTKWREEEPSQGEKLLVAALELR